jgi:hypothetical protein
LNLRALATVAAPPANRTAAVNTCLVTIAHVVCATHTLITVKNVQFYLRLQTAGPKQANAAISSANGVKSVVVVNRSIQ